MIGYLYIKNSKKQMILKGWQNLFAMDELTKPLLKPYLMAEAESMARLQTLTSSMTYTILVHTVISKANIIVF
jgi:hypothetical protein